jgi:hypothetical protein
VPPGTTQAAIAARLNNEGVNAFAAARFGDASAKFREAVARVPEAIYFFHLCLSLEHEGKFDEALTACNAVPLQTPPADLASRADAEIARIKEQARQQGIVLQPRSVD